MARSVIAARSVPADSDPVAKSRAFYADVGIRPDHPNAADFGAYFDRIWRAQGRRPELDSAEEQLGYLLARPDYAAACTLYRRHQQRADTRPPRARARAAKRNGTRRRGAGRPAARRSDRGGDSGDGDGLADDPDSDPPGVGRAIRRARARAPPLPSLIDRPNRRGARSGWAPTPPTTNK